MRATAKTFGMLLGTAALALAPSSAISQYNNPPVANPNGISIYVCQTLELNLTGNDSDPDGDYPLTVTAVDSSPYASIWISSASSVTVVGETPGGHSLTYTVEDSRGASSTGIISLGVFSGGGHCD